MSTPALAELWQMMRFGLVGLVASISHILVAALVLYVLPVLHEFWVNVIAYGVAFGVSLMGHQRVTFQRTASLWRFTVMSLTGFGINNLVLVGALGIGFSGLIAIAPAVVVAATASYVLSRCWVFT
ncbi:GtrA family protein [Halomonas sp. Bachu 37]|uniref:GtrA family protein n=1 Tax=Halomonas kashgarensis TaxID=3084920 RepID=UPI003216CBBA